nr:GNAT family N-acetyltransferase [Kineosporia babensis]
MEIARAEPEDADEVFALWEQSLGQSSSGAVALQRARERLGAALRTGDAPAVGEPEVLVARMADRAVAFVVLRQAPLNLLTGATALCLDEFYVAAAHRRHGVGRALLVHVAGQAERLGVEQIVAEVPLGSKDAQRYFAKLGFAPVLVRRACTPAVLRRRLSGADARRGTLEHLLSRRRSLRARARRLPPSDDAPLAG